jgi:peptide/nickel transport system permease protein
MVRYIVRRLVEAVPVLLLASFAVFMLVRLVPGDPASALAGPDATPEQVQQLRVQLNLNGNPFVQYVHWLGHAFEGNFGSSIQYRLPVAHLIRTQLEPTLQLGLAAYIFCLIVGIGLGVMAARSSLWNYIANIFAGIAIGVPTFVLGILLLVLFAAQWQVLPSGGWASFTDDPGLALKDLILPTVALGCITSAVLMRFVRTSLRQVLQQDYIRTARAKGIAERSVVMSHALRNALIPVITVSALQVGRLLAGALVIELVFARPGLGRLIVDGVQARDYPLIQALILLFVLVFILVNLIADVTYGLVDPRIRQ